MCGYFIWYFGSMSYLEDIFGRRRDKLWMTPLGKNVICGKDNFGQGVLKEVSNPVGHHGIAPLGKCHYEVLVPVLWL